MKNFNLIKRLFMDSHEKQSPQRFGRYAAMLIMLLTLGVGQMWATKTIYYANPNDWDPPYCYAWGTGNNGWPGKAMTATDHKKDGHTIYKIDLSDSYTKCIFSNNGANQTDDITFTAGKVTSNGTTWYTYDASYWDAEYGSRNIYLDISNNTGWKVANGYVGFHTYYSPVGASEDYKARYDATLVEGNIYVVTASTINSAYVRSFKAARWSTSGGDDWNSSNQINANTSKNKLSVPSGGWSGCTLTWGVYVPTVSSVSLTYNVVPSSGSGTAGSPYLVPTGTTVRVTANPTSVISDGACTMKYSWDSGSYGTTAYKDLNCSVAGNTYSTTVTCKNYISSDGGNTASATVYFRAVSDPTIALNSVTPSSSIVAGNDITLVGERANSSNAISFQYTTNDGSTWTDITPKTTSGDSPKTITWTIPDAHGATQTFKFRAKLAEATPIYSSKSSGVSVYNTKTIYVRNTNSWANFYSYVYNYSGGATTSKREEWPGSTTNGVSTLYGQWKTVVLTSQYGYFIFNNGSSSSQLKGETYTYSSSVSDGGYYYIKEGTGNSLTLTSCDAPEAPTVTTSEATVNSATSLTFNYSANANRDKATPGIAYKQSDSNIADAATLYSTGTKVAGAATNGNTSGSTSAKTISAGKDWYYVAYATNGVGTSYGSILKIRTTTVTLDNQSATTAGATSVVAVGGKAMPSIAANLPAKTGYTFGGYWTGASGTGTQYYNADGSSANNWKTNGAASETLKAKWTANKYDATLKLNGGTGTDNQVVQATYDADMPTVLKTSGSAISIPTRTGYTLLGYWDATSSGNQYYAYGGSPATLSSYRTWNKTSATNLYARWQANQYTLTLYKNDGGDTYTTQNATYDAGITITAPTRTGYTFAGYWTTASGAGTKIIDTDNHFVASVDGYTGAGKIWKRTSATNLYARWTANNYDVILDKNGATSGSSQTVTATFDAAMPTVQKGGSTPISAPSKTGYTFGGYTANNNGTGTQYYTAGLASNHVWDVATNNTHIYAKWTAKSYTVTLDVDEANKGTIAGATTSQSVTYDGATTTVPSRPTAATGYALYGYYTEQLGEGTKVINADGTWIASVAGYTDGSKNWIHDGDVTLYAYYKKAEITELTLSSAIVAPNTNFTVTPTLDPASGVQGTIVVCYKVQYSNGTELPSQPAMSQVGNVVTITAPAASATYRIEAKLRLNDCSGTVLDTRVTTFQVAGSHEVTIRYQDNDGRTLAPSTSITARPLEWTSAGAITPPTITGYTFARWDAGDGVSIKNGASDPVTTTTTASIQIKANYDGTLTAVYNKKNMIFFNNTLGWSDVYVYFYNSDEYWSGDYGSGALKNQEFNGDHKPYYEEEHGHMTQIEGTNIWYFDYTAAGYSTRANVVFTEGSQHGNQWFWKTKAVRRGDHNSSLPMFVPINTKTETKNQTDYYSNGYWMNYPENTGYVLHVYNGTTYGASDQMQEIPFVFTEDKTMPMSINVELNASRTYGFEIHRADGTVLGENSYTLVSGNSGDVGQTTKTLGESERSKITTTVAGDYTFTLSYGNSDGYKYLIGVHYPAATGDYRIVYNDRVAWSGAAHSESWWHESRTIHKENGAEDVVSFYVSKADGASASMKFQYASAINASTGAVTWMDVASGSIDISSITETGVYDFHLTQANGAISVSSITPYTGNYYIRTDCAGSTKWENFRTADHQMTYSDYAEKYSYDDASKRYTHYYCHWVTAGTNVKFVIANDNSLCISDTLTQDYGTVVANINSSGTLQNYNANIRFMWNEATNKISRAYIGGSGTITDRFLVLEGDAKMYDENGHALTGDYQDHNQYGVYLGTDNQVIMHDDENFVYERTVKVNASARAKLTAKYNSKVQYFKGSEGAFADGTTVQLLGGTYDVDKKYSMRIVYDFKTNRLVTAYMPEGEVDEAIAINADLMLVREHQEAGQQLIFKGEGALSEVKTVYGVMRFNRWTLNNKSTAAGHAPLGDPKSAYERALYWISFPFDVNLSDVFGFGTYGVDWIIEYYDGVERASKGYWVDSPSFWRYVTNRDNFVLKAGKGYVLALDIDRMKDNNTSFWVNNIEQVELFFPSASHAVGNIEATDVTTTVDSHACTIDRTGNNGSDINKNRTKADSHWNMIGVPSYANYGTTLTSDGSTTITWNSTPSATNSLPFLYEYNLVDNTYTVQSGTTYPFKAMHAYMVQYFGELHWSLASATPASIVARRTYADAPQNVEMRLELQQNDKMVDQTFVKMSNDEEVSTNFVFDEDLCKEYNGSKANIYTFIESYIPAAGNTLPMSKQTTIVPVGVDIKADGDYTFAIPDGTTGIGVTLIDNETGIRTSLSALDYAVFLEAGTYDKRFVLEISAVLNTPTDIINVQGDDGQGTKARKMMIDGIMYIVKDGKLFDAHGARVQ